MNAERVVGRDPLVFSYFLDLYNMHVCIQVVPGQAGGRSFKFETPIGAKAVLIGDRQASCADAMSLEC